MFEQREPLFPDPCDRCNSHPPSRTFAGFSGERKQAPRYKWSSSLEIQNTRDALTLCHTSMQFVEKRKEKNLNIINYNCRFSLLSDLLDSHSCLVSLLCYKEKEDQKDARIFQYLQTRKSSRRKFVSFSAWDVKVRVKKVKEETIYILKGTRDEIAASMKGERL